MDDITRPVREDDGGVRERTLAKGPADGLDAHLSAEAGERELVLRDRGAMEARGDADGAAGGGRGRKRPARGRAAEEPAGRTGGGADAERGDDDEAPPLDDPAELARVLLGVLLVAREPISSLRLAQVCNATQHAVAAGLERLQDDLRKSGLPLQVSAAGDAFRLLTLPEVFPYLKRLRKVKKAERLSPAALETLAVVAYRQPVMRAEIEAIRGVKVGPTLRTLLDHQLIDVVGRADVPGRPLQYGTTQHFLDRFGLPSLDDLPSVKEFRSLG